MAAGAKPITFVVPGQKQKPSKLIPIEIEPLLSGSTAIVLQLDQATARLPWEMLESTESLTESPGDREPWAVRAKVLRKLRSVEFRENPVGAGRDGKVLVIGEPETDPALFAELPNAREEAESVADVLKTVPLLQPNALATVSALLAQPYRIVHIAGHGVYRKNGAGGVALSNRTVLGPREINAMRAVPELVFINCCHLGAIHPDPKIARNALGARRSRFAAGVAEQLIHIGVRCVVAAGWAIEDGPAKIFATTFYRELLGGQRFIDAVGDARKAAWQANPRGNTWAAYQAYGDPDWRYVLQEDGGANAAPDPRVVSQLELETMLETLAMEAKYADTSQSPRSPGPGPGDKHERARLESIRRLEARYGTRWGSQGAVAEAFARAFAETGDLEAAIRWYERATAAADGSASLTAIEQLGNLRAERAATLTNVARARREIRAAIALLQTLSGLRPTVERESLLGSAWRRLSELEDRGRRGTAALSALTQMVAHYGHAETLARKTNAHNLFYPAMNCVAAEVRLACSKKRLPELDVQRLASIRQSLESATKHRPEFRSVSGLTELSMFEAVARGKLATPLPGILAAHRDLKTRVAAPRWWSSVAARARFTLEPYLRMASAAERAAATHLLAELDQFAIPTSPQAGSSETEKPGPTVRSKKSRRKR